MHAEQLSQILLAPWRQRDRSAPWGRRLLLALVVLTTLGSLVFLDAPRRWMLPAVVLLILIHTAWFGVAASLHEQNHPALARCVPGHVSTLQRAALLGWLSCSVAGALLLAATLPAWLSWQSLLLGNAVAAAFTLWAVRAWWLWFVVSFGAPLMGAFGELLAPLRHAAFALWQARADACLALGLIGLALAVRGAFGHGDVRHRRAYERLSRVRQVQQLYLEGRQVSPVQAFSGLERLAAPFNEVIDAWRRRVVARADNRRPASILARAELVLNANQHWTYQLLTALTVVVTVPLTLWLVMVWTSVPAADLLQHGALGISIGLSSMAVNPTLARPMLWQTRREQALLRLLPGMPQGAALNRAVAWIGLRHALAAALLSALLLLPLAWATARPALLWLPVMAVPWAVCTVTRAPARMRPPSGLNMMLPVFAFYGCAGLGYLASDRLGLPMAPLVAAVLAAAGLIGAYRWRRLDAQPAALPAGRLA